MTLTPDDVKHSAVWLIKVLAQGGISHVTLRVHEAAGNDLTYWILSLGESGPGLFDRIDVEMVPPGRDVYQLQSPEQIKSFRSLQEVKDAFSVR